MQGYEELFSLARKLTAIAEAAEQPEFKAALDALEQSADAVSRAFSGSWLGYHSRVYYSGLIEPPPGAHFSQEWGSLDTFGSYGTRGDWCEFSSSQVRQIIQDRAGQPDLSGVKEMARRSQEAWSSVRAEALSILEQESSGKGDNYLEKLKREIDKTKAFTVREAIGYWQPTGQIMSRDTTAFGQGILVPPHIDVAAEVVSLRSALDVCRRGADKIARAASHLQRRSSRKRADDRIGTNVFVGHGRSPAWRELKDFLETRLNLPWDEFNRVPVAGVTNIARLSEMLDAAAIALLVFTAEDELADGSMQARMNVVHEAGLFQGRLGFARAIIMVEEGCVDFSNIQGLGQIRFPKSNIAAAFEEVRRVLEREGLIEDR